MLRRPPEYQLRPYDGYPRPNRSGLIILLGFILAGVVWIDLYDVPAGLRALGCDIRVTPWSGILTSPKVVFGVPIILAELAVWARIVVWLWPVKVLAPPVMSDWVALALVFVLGIGLFLYELSAMQPAPWNACALIEPGALEDR